MEDQKNMQTEEKMPKAQKVQSFDLIIVLVLGVANFVMMMINVNPIVTSICTIVIVILSRRVLKRRGHMNHLRKIDK